jgi:hypothetical protein
VHTFRPLETRNMFKKNPKKTSGEVKNAF